MKKQLITFLCLFFVVGLFAQDEYCKTAKTRNGASRAVSQVTVTRNSSDGSEEIFKETAYPATAGNYDVYLNSTDKVIEVNRGDELVLGYSTYNTVDNFKWIKFYLYIDYNKNIDFLDEGELVSYTNVDGKDSEGNTVVDEGFPPMVMPKFTIPADAPLGETRVRLYGDWGGTPPCEVKDANPVMIDYTIRIVDSSLQKFAVTFAQPATGGTFKVMDGDVEITSGTEITEETVLKVVAEPAADYRVKEIKVNGTAITGNEFTVTEATTIEVEFEEAVYCRTAQNRNASSRNVTEVIINKITGETESEIFKENAYPATGNSKTYLDLTQKIIDVKRGDELVLSYTTNNSTNDFKWIKFYLYIDFDSNIDFMDEGELVSFTNIDGKDSEGNTVVDEGFPPMAMPKFVIPADAPLGETRLRLYGDWAGTPPCEVESSNAVMIDYTIRISEPAAKYPVTFTQPAAGGTFKVLNGSAEITSGTEVEEGTVLKVETQPATDYRLKTIKVNSKAITGQEFTVTAASTVEVEFEEATYCTVNTNRNGDTRLIGDVVINRSTGSELTQIFKSTVNTKPTRAGESMPTYKDLTAEVINVSRGDQLILSFNDVSFKDDFSWLKMSIWIDYDSDKIFDLASGEKVTFTEIGSKTSDPEAYKFPVFTIPADAQLGATRLRFLGRWNNENDPCGPIADVNSTMIDFTINITEGVSYPVTFTQPEEGGTFKVLKGNVEIASGDEIPQGTALIVETTLTSEDYYQRAILVNGEPITGNELLVTGETTIAADIIKGRIISYAVGNNGSLSVTSGGNNIVNQGVVLLGASVNVKATPDAEYHVQSVMVNAEDKTTEASSEQGYTFTVAGNTDIQALYAINTYKFTYTYNQEGGSATVRKNGVPVTSGSMVEYGTELDVTLNLTGSYSLKSISINGVDKTEELLPEGGNNFKFTLAEETDLAIVFEPETFILTYNNPANGSMYVALNSQDLENGAVIPYGEYLEISFIPMGGYELKSLVINGQDFLEFVEDDMTFYEIKSDVNIVAEFKMIGGSSLDDTTGKDVYAYFKEGSLIIKDAAAGSMVDVYNMTGTKIVSKTITSNNETIDFAGTNGIYMVKISYNNSNKVLKVINR